MNTKRILLVEDSPDDEALIVRALQKSNLANPIDIVRDGAEALDYLFHQGAYASRPSGNPQVVLLDIQLPKINGLEVLKAIREHEVLAHLPIVILTSSSEDLDLIKGYGLGANSYVRKPVDFDQFVEAIKNLGLYWVVLNQGAP